ncbi:hypothetical protein ES705_47970 [subsurface metagenome]
MELVLVMITIFGVVNFLYVIWQIMRELPISRIFQCLVVTKQLSNHGGWG